MIETGKASRVAVILVQNSRVPTYTGGNGRRSRRSDRITRTRHPYGIDSSPHSLHAEPVASVSAA